MTTSTGIDAHELSLAADGHTLLDGINLRVGNGEVLGIIGPNGAGKSTLLKVLAGITVPDSGTVHCAGRNMAKLTPREKARLIAWLEQRPVLHWPLSAAQVVALGRLPWRGEREGQRQAAIDAALAHTGVAALAERRFNTLSEGEKLLVNLARLLATGAGIILADEPTAALDPGHQLQVMDLLRRQAADGAALVTVLHDLGLAARYCDRLLLLHEGRVIADGTPESVLDTETLAAVYGVRGHYDPVRRLVVIEARH